MSTAVVVGSEGGSEEGAEAATEVVEAAAEAAAEIIEDAVEAATDIIEAATEGATGSTEQATDIEHRLTLLEERPIGVTWDDVYSYVDARIPSVEVVAEVAAEIVEATTDDGNATDDEITIVTPDVQEESATTKAKGFWRRIW